MALQPTFQRARRSALGAGLAATLVVLPATAAFATPVDPDASPVKGDDRTSAGFTVLVERSADVGRGGGEIEGSLAVGGTLSFGTYNLNANTDGSPMPTAVAPRTQLLTGGTVVTGPDAQKLDVNAGRAAIGDTSGMLTTADGRLTRLDDPGYVLGTVVPRQQSIDAYDAAGAFDAVFPIGTFDDVRADAASMTALAENGAAEVDVIRDADRLKVMLVAGATNVWTVAAGGFAGVNEVTFADAMPSATTPLVINVLPGASTDFSPARFLGDGTRSFAPWVTWNFDGWEALRLVGAVEMGGLLVAPDTALDYHRDNPFRGQLIVESLAITAAGEIHHYEHPGAPVEPTGLVEPTEPVEPTELTAQVEATTPADSDDAAAVPAASAPASEVLASTGFEAAAAFIGLTAILAGLGAMLVVRRGRRA